VTDPISNRDAEMFIGALAGIALALLLVRAAWRALTGRD